MFIRTKRVQSTASGYIVTLPPVPTEPDRTQDQVLIEMEEGIVCIVITPDGALLRNLQGEDVPFLLLKDQHFLRFFYNGTSWDNCWSQDVK